MIKSINDGYSDSQWDKKDADKPKLCEGVRREIGIDINVINGKKAAEERREETSYKYQVKKIILFCRLEERIKNHTLLA